MVRSVLHISSRINTDNLNQTQVLNEIKTNSTFNNLENEITGVLVVGASHFLNIVEGSKSNVADLILKIEADERHKDNSLVFDCYYEDRIFPDWRLIEQQCHETSHRFNEMLMQNADALVMIDNKKFELIEKMVNEILH